MSSDDHPELPGITEVGCGYNVNGDYASANAVKQPLFDLYKNGEKTYQFDNSDPNSKYRMPKLVNVNRYNQTYYSFASGEDSKELCNSMNVKTKLEGSYGMFSGSLSVDFNKSELETRHYKFTRVQYSINLYILQLIGSEKDMAGLLTASARRDIKEMDPTKLFDTYGCYYLASLVMGGRSVMGASTSKYSFESSNSLQTVAEASFGGKILSASASVDATLKNDIKSFNESSKISIMTKGGDSQYGSQLPEKYSEWSKSVQTFPIFVDFHDAQSLRGIWTLAESPARQKALKDAALKYLASNANQFAQHDGPVLLGKKLPLTKWPSSGAFMPELVFKTWKPTLGSGDAGWYWFGPVAYGDINDHSGETGLVVQEIVKGALGDIGSWQNVYTENIFFAINSGWHPLPKRNVDYVPLGSFCKIDGIMAKSAVAPSSEETAGIKMLHRSFAKEGSFGTQISQFNNRMSLWAIQGDAGPRTFVASGSGSKPNRVAYTIKDGALTFDLNKKAPSAEAIVKERMNNLRRNLQANNAGNANKEADHHGNGPPPLNVDLIDAPLDQDATPASYVHKVFDNSVRAPASILHKPVPIALALACPEGVAVMPSA